MAAWAPGDGEPTATGETAGFADGEAARRDGDATGLTAAAGAGLLADVAAGLGAVVGAAVGAGWAGAQADNARQSARAGPARCAPRPGIAQREWAYRIQPGYLPRVEHGSHAPACHCGRVRA